MTSVPSSIFARRLRQERENAGLSQADLAKLISETLGSRVDPSAITRIEKFDRAVKLDEATAAAAIFRLPLTALLIEGDPAPHLSQQLKQYLLELASAKAGFEKSRTEVERLTNAVLALTDEQNKLRDQQAQQRQPDPGAADRADHDSTA